MEKIKMKKGLFYFAHPYTVKDKDGNYVPEAEEANFQLANYRAGRLLLAGYNIYSPISHTHPIHRATIEFLKKHEHKLWYDFDLAFIEHANFTGIILAPGWEESEGCRLEYEIFRRTDKPILLYELIIHGTRILSQ